MSILMSKHTFIWPYYSHTLPPMEQCYTPKKGHKIILHVHILPNIYDQLYIQIYEVIGMPRFIDLIM